MSEPLIEQAIYEHLRDDPAVYALAQGRIHIGIAPPSEPYPLAQFFLVSEMRHDRLEGGAEDVGEEEGGVFQVDSYARQGAGVSGHVIESRRLATAIEHAFRRFRTVQAAGVLIHATRLMGGRGPLFESDGALAHYSHDYELWWRAA